MSACGRDIAQLDLASRDMHEHLGLRRDGVGLQKESSRANRVATLEGADAVFEERSRLYELFGSGRTPRTLFRKRRGQKRVARRRGGSNLGDRLGRRRLGHTELGHLGRVVGAAARHHERSAKFHEKKRVAGLMHEPSISRSRAKKTAGRVPSGSFVIRATLRPISVAGEERLSVAA